MNYNRIQNRKILVTGGAGFIGSNLCEDLLQWNNEVVCFDNFSTGHRSNLSSFISHPKFKLIEGDIRNLADLHSAMQEVEIVLHQAALCSVPRSLDDPITSNEVNINGFLNMLVAARDAKVKRIVYAASSSSYGDSEQMPKVEDIVGKPLSPYAVTKYVNELYAHVFKLNYGMEIIGLRYFNVFGRRQSPNGAYAAVIPKFAEQFLRCESPVINGDGSYSRDFTYIDNVIQMNHLAATTENQQAIGEVFNTAVGERTTILQLTESIRRILTGYDSRIGEVGIHFGPSRRADVPHSLASIEKAKKMLDYQPAHALDAGLEEALKWYWTSLSGARK